MRLKRPIYAFVFLVPLTIGLTPKPSSAATAVSVMAVSATVLSFCTIVALPLVFGNYSAVDNDATAAMTVVCTTTTPFNIGLSAGGGTGATVATRKMSNGLNSLNYGLYSDAAHTVNWGNTVGTDTLSGIGTGLAQILTVYGRIPAGQFAGPGVYSDVILATITY